MTDSLAEAPASHPQITVVLPCLDEVASVGLCVGEALSAMRGAGLTGEVVVVDNGSSDGSPEAATAAGARVVHEVRKGYGSALRAGFEAARGEVVVMADADSTYPLDKLPLLVAPVLAGEADMVLGARLDAATRGTMPLLHRFVGTPAISFLIARACGRRVVGDSQSGFRAFDRAAVAELNLRSTGMELASEMLIRSAHAGLRIREVQTGYRERIGESKLDTFSDGWRHLQLILLLAPELLLVWPGAALIVLGVVLSLASLVADSGIELGSLRWQPVFFSSIALVLGTQATLAGAVLSYRSSVVSRSVHQRFAWVGSPSFPRRCLTAGIVSGLLGLAIDFVLFLDWVGSDARAVDELAAAGLAQSLLIVGGTLGSFGILARFLTPWTPRRDVREASRTSITSD